MATLSIDLHHIRANIRRLQKLLGPKTQLMCMVKSNGYGLGAITIAKAALEEGVSLLGINHVREAQLLRQAGIRAKIFSLSVNRWEFAQALEEEVAFGIDNLKAAEELSEIAKKRERVARVHLHVDTGLRRYGCLPQEAKQLAGKIARLPHVVLEGIMTHPIASEGPLFDHQIRVQMDMVLSLHCALAKEGISPPHVHAQNSHALFAHPDPRFTIARVGMALYGYCTAAPKGLLHPTTSLITRIAKIQPVSPGETAGYFATWTAPKGSCRLAVLPVGCAEGLPKFSTDQVLIHNQLAPIVGQSFMNHCLVDVSHIPQAKPGDQALFWSSDPESPLTLEVVAKRRGISPYELLAGVGSTVQRNYFPSSLLCQALAGDEEANLEDLQRASPSL